MLNYIYGIYNNRFMVLSENNFTLGGNKMYISMKKDTKRGMYLIGLLCVSMVLGVVLFSDMNVIMILQKAGVHVTKGLAEALTSIGSVYGVQQAIIAALGVTVPLWAAAAVAAAGAASL